MRLGVRYKEGGGFANQFLTGEATSYLKPHTYPLISYSSSFAAIFTVSNQ